MGSSVINALQQFLNGGAVPSAVPGQNGQETVPAATGATTAPDPKDLFVICSPSNSASDLEDAIYQSQMQKLHLSLQMQEFSGSISGAGQDGQEGDTVQLAGKQLTFEFYGESRTEQLAMFRKSTADTAAALPEGKQSGYMEMSQQIATRFRMSVSVSATTLQGFSNSTAQLKDASGDSLDQLMKLTQQALGKTDDLLNQMFEVLGAFVNGSDDFQAKVDKLFKMLQGMFDNKPGMGTGNGQSQAASVGPAKGATINISSLNIQLEFSFESTTVTSTQGVQESDPITFDLDGDGVELTSYRNGARFDIEGKGRTAQTAFVTGGDAFLALDRNGNGKIDSGLELFGDQRGAANGYQELAKLDSNGDGKISSADNDFAKLRLFKDNGDGKTDTGELISLQDAGIAELGLNYRDVKIDAAGGNRIAQVASYKRNDGSEGQSVDSVLKFLA